jgi:hypothetical protein|tara:strand:+ start:38 stop:580 length:543 start_codon:yes stop_codon:yes gene_type:complete
MNKIENYKFHSYSLTSVKVHDDMSEETLCFSAKLVNPEGKVVAVIKNSGTGGCNHNDFNSPKEEKAFYEHIKGLTYYNKHAKKEMTYCDEVYVDELMSELEMRKHSNRGYFTSIEHDAEKGDFGILKSGNKKVRWTHKGLAKYIANNLEGYFLVNAPQDLIDEVNQIRLTMFLLSQEVQA